jgi:hypothetical protein
LRKIVCYTVVIVLAAMIIFSSMINNASATKETIKQKFTGKHDQHGNPIYEYETTTETTFWQILGIIVIVIIVVAGSPGAFMEPITVPVGWTYTTDGNTYLNVYPPSPINSSGIYGPITWQSIESSYTKFYWETRGSNNSLLETGQFILSTVGGTVVPVDKFGLLAPYIGLASTILVATAVAAVCILRVKRRKEKQ